MRPETTHCSCSSACVRGGPGRVAALSALARSKVGLSLARAVRSDRARAVLVFRMHKGKLVAATARTLALIAPREGTPAHMVLVLRRGTRYAVQNRSARSRPRTCRP